MEQEILPSPKFSHSPEPPRNRAVFGDVISALETLNGAVRQLETHPLVSEDLPEILRSVADSAGLSEDLGALRSRLERFEGRVSEAMTRLEVDSSEAMGKLRGLGGNLGGISEKQDAVSIKVEDLERMCGESKENIRSIREGFLAAEKDIGSVRDRIKISEKKVVKLWDGLNEVYLWIEELKRGRKSADDGLNKVVSQVEELQRRHQSTDQTLTAALVIASTFIALLLFIH